MLDHTNEDYLRENLLGEDEDYVPAPTQRSADLPEDLDHQEVYNQDSDSYRLVIAVDYGTTFTGEHSPLVLQGS